MRKHMVETVNVLLRGPRRYSDVARALGIAGTAAHNRLVHMEALGVVRRVLLPGKRGAGWELVVERLRDFGIEG